VNKQLRQHLPNQFILFLTYLFARLRGVKVHRSAIIYPTAQMSRYPKNISVERYAILKAGSKLTACNGDAFISIGKRTTLGEQSLIYASCDVSIGDDVMIGPRLYIVDSQHGMSLGAKMNQQIGTKKPVVVGNDCWIGANVTILAGVRIADGCVVGAGSVVIQDVPAFTVVAGVPARFIRTRT